jgi:hypothetical protein
MNKITKYPTLFVDIDGTLVKYRKFANLANSILEPIQDVIDKINEAYSNGSVVVITTARPEEYRDYTIGELTEVGVKFHQLVMGIGRGTRYLINDKDPEKPEIERAVAINLTRDQGIKNIDNFNFKKYESE